MKGIHVLLCRSSLLAVPFCHSTDTLIELIGVEYPHHRKEVIARKRVEGSEESEGVRFEVGGDDTRGKKQIKGSDTCPNGLSTLKYRAEVQGTHV